MMAGWESDAEYVNELTQLEDQLKETPQEEQPAEEEENMDLDRILETYGTDLNCRG